MKIERFEDIQAWQEARKLTAMIYDFSSAAKFRKDYGLSDQIRRASVSVMANIAEGFGRKTSKEFHQFLNIANASAFEVQSHLYVALDLGYLGKQDFDDAFEQSRITSRLIGGFINYLNSLKIEKPDNQKPDNRKTGSGENITSE